MSKMWNWVYIPRNCIFLFILQKSLLQKNESIIKIKEH